MVEAEHQAIITLGGLFQQGFDAMAVRFDSLDSRFDALAHRFDVLDRCFDDGFADMRDRFDAILGQIEHIAELVTTVIDQRPETP